MAQGASAVSRPLRIRGTCSVNAAHGLERCWWLGKHARSEIRGIPRGARFCEGASSAFGAWTLMVAASLAPESVTIRTPCCSLTARLSTDSTHAPAPMDRRGDGGVSAPAGVAARGVRDKARGSASSSWGFVVGGSGWRCRSWLVRRGRRARLGDVGWPLAQQVSSQGRLPVPRRACCLATVSAPSSAA